MKTTPSFICFFICFLTWTLPASSQIDKELQSGSFQFGPFYAHLQIDLQNHPCIGLAATVARQEEEGYYWVSSFLADNDEYLRIGLSSSLIKNFKVLKRTTFTYGVFDSGAGITYYNNTDIPFTQKRDSESRFCTKWSEVAVKGTIKKIPTNEPFTPNKSFLDSCVQQASITEKQLQKHLLIDLYPTEDLHFSNVSYTIEELKKMVDEDLKVYKETTELQIQYIENDKPTTITIVFPYSAGECKL